VAVYSYRYIRDKQYPYWILRGLVRQRIYGGTNQCIRFTYSPIRRDVRWYPLRGYANQMFRTNTGFAEDLDFIHYLRITARNRKNSDNTRSGCVNMYTEECQRSGYFCTGIRWTFFLISSTRPFRTIRKDFRSERSCFFRQYHRIMEIRTAFGLESY